METRTTSESITTRRMPRTKRADRSRSNESKRRTLAYKAERRAKYGESK